MNILIIGYGSIAKKHIQALKTLNQPFKFFALRFNPNVETIEGIESIFKWENIPSNIDLCIISNPTMAHFETINKISKLGIPMFIEKPVLHTLTNSDHLLKEIEDKKLFTYVACNLRFHPMVQFLKQTILENKNKVNEVNIYCGSYLPDWRPNVDFRKVYSANSEMGGGVQLDLIHEIDYSYWLFGKPSKINSVTRNVSSLKIDAPDFVQYLFQFPTFAVNITLNYYRRDYKRTIEILFENETWIADFKTGKILNHKNEVVFETKTTLIDTYPLQLKYVLHCLENGIAPMNNINEAIDVLKLCLGNE